MAGSLTNGAGRVPARLAAGTKLGDALGWICRASTCRASLPRSVGRDHAAGVAREVIRPGMVASARASLAIYATLESPERNGLRPAPKPWGTRPRRREPAVAQDQRPERTAVRAGLGGIRFHRFKPPTVVPGGKATGRFRPSWSGSG
jgi:hypothetical protein